MYVLLVVLGLQATVMLDFIAMHMHVHVKDFQITRVKYVVLNGLGMTIRQWFGGTGKVMSHLNVLVGEYRLMVGRQMTVLMNYDMFVTEVSDLHCELKTCYT